MPERVFSVKPVGRFIENKANVFQKYNGNCEVIANIEYRLLKEEGTITLSHPAQVYTVTHSQLAGIWNLQLDDAALSSNNNPLIVATKPKWYKCTVTFKMGGDVYEMFDTGKSMLSGMRDYEVWRLAKPDMAEFNSVDQDGNKSKKNKKKASPRHLGRKAC